jgi:pilus assembly protein CpaB
VSELQGTMVRAPIYAGEPIRDMKLVRSDRGFLSAVLPKGMRAVAVRVNAASTAGGFILPNDRVDVLLVRQFPGNNARSQTLLTNIRVLAIDQLIENTGGEQKSVVVAQDTATLELSPEQAELIAQAQQTGTISLSLRSIEDSASEPDVIQKPSGVSVVKFGIPTRITAPRAQ